MRARIHVRTSPSRQLPANPEPAAWDTLARVRAKDGAVYGVGKQCRHDLRRAQLLHEEADVVSREVRKTLLRWLVDGLDSATRDGPD